MAVLIGHASISENGTVNGTAGDSTGKEVCTRNWYNGSWGFMAVHPDATVREAIASAVEKACANDKIGYSQATRNTLYTQAKTNGLDLSKVTTACNCDCSSLINTAVVCAGKGSYGSNGWTTSTMQSQLSALGFKILTSNVSTEAYAVRGAIYCKAGSHVICALSNGSKASTTLTNAGASGTVTTPTVSTTSGVAWIKELQTECNEQGLSKQTVDGIAGPITLKGCPLLKSGSKGNITKIMQARIIAAGYTMPKYGADGDFGTETETAVKKYQSAKGLSADGKVGPLTWSKLLGLS